MVALVLGAPPESLLALNDLNLQRVEQIPDSGYYLRWQEDRWVVADSSQGPRFVIDLNLDEQFQKWKQQRLNPKKDLLGRAVGMAHNPSPYVFDATLGLGGDALHLISLGCRVVSVERQPVVAFLMKQALQRSVDLQKHWQIHCGEAQELIKDFEDRVDVAFLDPMFEGVNKKSAPKKEISLLRSLAVEGEPSEIVGSLLQTSLKRVVVKRPLDGDHLIKKPANQFNGKLIRYDVYIR